jgi:hypothetical protein
MAPQHLPISEFGPSSTPELVSEPAAGTEPKNE